MSDRRIVYSTGPDGVPSGRPADCALPPERQSIRVRRDRSGRKGKTVTVAGTFLLDREEAAALLGQLKRGCGSGGTIKHEADGGFRIEVQGDHLERILEQLAARGFRVKQAGG